MKYGLLTVYCTDSTITLWWELTTRASPCDTYRVYVNGVLAGDTNKTHYTLEELHSETAYHIQVQSVLARTIIGSCEAVTMLRKQRLDVTKEPYNAVGDKKTLNTTALQKVMDDCGRGQSVYFPAGIYMTGALRLHSDMEIYLEEGAVLQGTAEPEDYLPRIRSRFEGAEMMCYSSLLNLGELDHSKGPNCCNVLIHGKGMIASGGQVLARRIIESEHKQLKGYLAEREDIVQTCENRDTIPGRVRPRLINMSNCSNIRLSGLTLSNGACWNVHMIYSDHIVTDHCTIRSEGVWNGDGWNPDSSEDCTIFACRFFTGDDCVAIKSGKNQEGCLIARPAKRINIFDCMSAFGHGITIGSEMSGGVEGVQIWHCDLGLSTYGIEIKGTKKRGGYVRNIHLQDCTVSRVLIHAVGYNDDGIGAPTPPIFGQCIFERIKILGKSLEHDGKHNDCPAIELYGFEVPGYEVQDVAFHDCTIQRNADIRLHACRNIVLELAEVD